MSAETPGVTPRTPGLDPERVRAATGLDFEDPEDMKVADRVLAADDAHARSRGLVCQGDALTREALDHLIGFAELSHRLSCARVRDMSVFDPDCRVCYLLAALPSSLLDNPEADRG